METRIFLRSLAFISYVLFFVFSFVKTKYAVGSFLLLAVPLVCIKLYEIVRFYIQKKRSIKLGKMEFNNSPIRMFLIGGMSILFLYAYIKFFNYLDLEPTHFLEFFVGKNGNSPIYYGIMSGMLIRSFIDNPQDFYITKKGLVQSANYFEDYLWRNFSGYKLIEEQSLIRFTKKNGKFLFVNYDASYFEEKQEEIIEILNKNIS